jgi:hypothetical protein
VSQGEERIVEVDVDKINQVFVLGDKVMVREEMAHARSREH